MEMDEAKWRGVGVEMGSFRIQTSGRKFGK